MVLSQSQNLMMSQNYTTFKKFPDAAEAKHLQQFLIENGIECLFINNSSQLDSNFSGGNMFKEYKLQLKQTDFERAHELLERHAKEMVAHLDKDYYLLLFTDEELYEVVLKQEEWNEFDYVLARRLLTERGKPLDDSLIKALRQQRITDLAKPEAKQGAWIGAGYVLALLGGFFGIIIGYVLWSSRKTLPNGQIVHSYSREDRAHGRVIFLIGIVVLPLAIFIRVILSYLKLS